MTTIHDVTLKYITDHIFSTYTKQEIDILHRIERCYFNAFNLTKENNINAAKLYNRYGDYFMKSAPFNLFHLIIILGWQKSAYFYYKTEKFEESIRRTTRIISSLEDIIRQHNLIVFWLYIIQQKLNLARVFIKKNELEVAIKIYEEADQRLNTNPYREEIRFTIGDKILIKVEKLFDYEIASGLKYINKIQNIAITEDNKDTTRE